MFAKIGPRMNRMTRLPVARSSSMTSAPEDVGRHQVRRELDPVELEVDRLRQLLDQQGLGEPRDAAQQAVAAGEERDQDLADDALLPDDDLGELALETAGELGDAFERDRRLLALGEVKAALGHDMDDPSPSLLRRDGLDGRTSVAGQRD